MVGEILLLLASAMTKEQIVENLSEAISEYQHGDPVKESAVAMHCQLFLSKMITDKESVQDAIEDIQKMKQYREMFDNKVS